MGDQIDDCRDLSSLFYLLPTQKGYLVNWDHQKPVWDYLFGKQCFNMKPDSTTLIFTEPLFNFSSIQEGLSEMFFEEYGFSRVLRTHAPDLSCYQVRTRELAVLKFQSHEQPHSITLLYSPTEQERDARGTMLLGR